MNALRFLVPLALATLSSAAPPVFQVAKTGGTHASLQAAVDACPNTGCRIELLDSLYSFSEPLRIRGKSDLEMVGARPDGSRPLLRIELSARELADIPSVAGHTATNTRTIVWKASTKPDTIVDLDGTRSVRSHDLDLGPVGKVARFFLAPGRDSNGLPDPARPSGWMVAPFTQAFTEDAAVPPELMAGYQFPALVQIERSRRVKVSRLEFDGELPLEFKTSSLWAGMFSQISGVAAIATHGSLMTRVEACAFHGWSIAFRAVDRNPGGLYTDLMVAEGTMPTVDWKPLSNPSAMGGHIFEGNLAWRNRMVVLLESGWDLGSSIRFNRAWDNGWSRLVTPGSRSGISESDFSSYDGGFARLHDVVYPTTVVQGNTLVRNHSEFSWGGWRASSGQLFLDNVVVKRDHPDWTELPYMNLGSNSRNNWWAARRADSWLTPSQDSIVPFCPSARCEPLVPAWGSAAVDANLVGRGFFGDDLGAVWQSGRLPEAIHLQDQNMPVATWRSGRWEIVLPVIVESRGSVSGMRVTKSRGQWSRTSTYDQASSSTSSGISLPALEGTPLTTGLNLLPVAVEGGLQDSLLRIELAVEGNDANTGRKVHSNLGSWIVRPLGKRLRVVRDDTGHVAPGETVDFTVEVLDSLGSPASLESAPSLNATGWTLAPSPAPATHPALRAVSLSERFAIRAVAPTTEGISQIVFWSAEPGREAAVVGATYLQVGGSSVGAKASGGRSPGWRLTETVRTPGGWRLGLEGAASADLSGATLQDARGRLVRTSIATEGGRTSLRTPPLPSGTYFLRVGTGSRILTLIP